MIRSTQQPDEYHDTLDIQYRFPLIAPNQRPGTNQQYPFSLYEQAVNLALKSYMYNDVASIDDPIIDAYLPYSCNIFNNQLKPPEMNNFEYAIIALYKDVLNRTPTKRELEKNIYLMMNNEIDAALLRIQLMNSEEYRRNVKLQSNEVLSDIEYSYAKEDLLSFVGKLYFRELNKEAPRMMLLPLKDLYMYLQSNEYLFRALLVHHNYATFESEVLLTRFITKSGIAELFSKYFTLFDLRSSANDIKKHDILERQRKQENPVYAITSAPGMLVSTTQITDATKDDDTSRIYDIVNSEADQIFNLHEIAQVFE